MFALTAPQNVQQNKDKSHCWAAALYSWMLATGRKGTSSTPISGYKQLVDQYSVQEDGGISQETLAGEVATDMRMGKSGPGLWDLSENGIEDILRKAGYMLLVYKSGVQSAHTLVVYGVGNYKIKCMDPWYGGPREWSFAEFNGFKPPMPKMMMWPTTSP